MSTTSTLKNNPVLFRSIRFDFSNKRALVIGGSRGIGKGVVESLVAAGADVFYASRSPANGETCGKFVKTDVHDEYAVAKLFTTIDDEGDLDFVINTSAINHCKSIVEIEAGEWDDVNAVNIRAAFLVCKEAAKRMMKGDGGSIINIVSIGGLTSLGRSHMAYGIGMGGVAQMTRDLSTEWSSKGVRVNAIVCAQIMNKGLKERIADDPKLGDTFLRGLPIGRLGQPDEIKGLAIFLASDASAWVTGALIPLDGGNLAKNAGGSHPGMPNAPDEQT